MGKSRAAAELSKRGQNASNVFEPSRMLCIRKIDDNADIGMAQGPSGIFRTCQRILPPNTGNARQDFQRGVVTLGIDDKDGIVVKDQLLA